MSTDFIARGLAQKTALAAGLSNPTRIDLRQFLDGVGQGSETIDTDALHMAWSEAATVVDTSDGNAKTLFPTVIALPPGELQIGSGLDSSEIAGDGQISFAIQGKGRNATRIKLTDPDSWLIDCGVRISSMLLSDMQIHLGAGAFRQRNAQSTVPTRSGSLAFQRCAFSDYSKAAIVSNSDNDPFYNIWDCKFTGGVDSKAILLPPGGGHVIGGGTWINGHKYGIVLREGNDSNIGYVRFGGLVAVNPRTDIWIIPESTKSGRGLNIHDCFHGNEGDNPEDREILIANADTTGNPDHASSPTWEDYGESTSNVTQGDVRQLRLRDNHYTADSGRARGIIYSRCEAISMTFDCNVDGDYPDIVEFDTNVIPALGLDNHFIQTSRIKLAIGASMGSAAHPNIGISNLPGFGFAEGYTDAVAGDPSVQRPGGSVIAQSLMSKTMSDFSSGTCALGSLSTDMAGGTEALEITFDRSNARCWQTLDMTDAVAGRLAWLEFDVKRAATQTVTEAQLRIGTAYNNRFRILRFRVEPYWQRIAIPFILPQTGSNIMAVFMPANGEYEAGVADKLMLGRVDAYHAECRV